MRLFLLSLFVVGVGCSVPTAANGRIWPCSWLHGRLTFGNGTPSVRIWPRGTRRLLGVVNPANPGSDVGELEALPANVSRLLGDNNFATIWGDFYVCPVAPEREGWMRFVVMKHARGLFLQDAEK